MNAIGPERVRFEIDSGTDGIRAHVDILREDLPLVALFSWRMSGGRAITDLCDVYLITVSMEFLIDHPTIATGSHGVN